MNMSTLSIGVDFYFSIIIIPNHDIIKLVAYLMITFSSIHPGISFRKVKFYFMFLPYDLYHGTLNNMIK